MEMFFGFAFVLDPPEKSRRGVPAADFHRGIKAALLKIQEHAFQYEVDLLWRQIVRANVVRGPERVGVRGWMPIRPAGNHEVHRHGPSHAIQRAEQPKSGRINPLKQRTGLDTDDAHSTPRPDP